MKGCSRARMYGARRLPAGQGLVETALGVLLLGALISGAALFVVTTGVACYYKSKVAYAAEAGARFGIETAEWLGAPRIGYSEADLKNDVTEVVNKTLQDMGLPPADSVDVEKSTVSGERLLSVAVTVRGLRVVGGKLLPGLIHMHETSMYSFQYLSTPAVMGLTIGAGQGIYLPAYGHGSNMTGPYTYPGGKFPYFAGYTQKGFAQLAGPFQNGGSGGAWVSN